MYGTSIVVVALALVKAVQGQCSIEGTTTVGAGATQLGSCQTFVGSIAIATDAPSTVDFGELGNGRGDFVADAALDVATISANCLATIIGQFTMNNMTSLFTVEMQELIDVGGGLTWQGLPLLQAVNFGPGLSASQSIDIQNTQIQDLSGINVNSVGTIVLVDNPALSDVHWETTNATNITIVANGLSTQGANVTLQSLEGVGELTLHNVSSIDLSSLAQVSNDLTIESAAMESIAVPKLTSAGSITIANNAQLTNVSMNELRTCGGDLKLINNDHLSGDVDFLQLAEVRGDLNVTGAFTSVQLPLLNSIDGSSYLWSSANIASICDSFGPSGAYAGSKIKGDILCRGDATDPPGSLAPAGSTASAADSPSRNSSTSAGGNDSPTSNTQSDLSGGAIAGIVIGVVAALAIVAGAIWALRAKRRSKASETSSLPGYEKPELAGTGVVPWWKRRRGRKSGPVAEMASREPVIRSELPGDKPKIHEMHVDERPREMDAAR